jgi:hypothetical protein
MHRYRIVAQISLILSILNLVLATPIVVQEIHEARVDEIVAADDVPAMPEKSDELGAASDRPTSPAPSPDAIASPQHSSLSDGSMSSGYPVPHLSSDSSDSGYSWLLDRPPRLNLSPHPPASSDGSASPHPSSPGPSGISTPAWLQELERQIDLEQEISLSPTRSSQLTGSNRASTETSHTFTTSHHSSASDELTPVSEVSPSSPPENAKFFTENMVKKLKIVAGVTIIGGAIAGIAGSQIINKHQHRDYQDS